nr:glutaminase [Azospirillum sp. B4]
MVMKSGVSRWGAAVCGGALALSLLLGVGGASAREAPPADTAIQQAVDQAYAKFKGVMEGENASYIPYLAKADPKLFGIAVVTADGRVFKAGDAGQEFPVESIAKVFTLARVLKDQGPDAVMAKIGVNATGQPFNSVLAIELNNDKLTGSPPAGNPLVNAGAIAAASLVPGADLNTRWKTVLDTASSFAGRTLALNQDVYQSEMAGNQHNQAIALLLQSYDHLYADPAMTVDLYTRECSYNVSAVDLATMGATLANGGTNPVSHKAVVDPAHQRPGAGRHGHRRPLQHHGRVAVQGGPAGQERRGRRHSGGGAGQAGHRRLLLPPGRRRQQRARPVGGAIHRRGAGPEPVRGGQVGERAGGGRGVGTAGRFAFRLTRTKIEHTVLFQQQGERAWMVGSVVTA